MCYVCICIYIYMSIYWSPDRERACGRPQESRGGKPSLLAQSTGKPRQKAQSSGPKHRLVHSGGDQILHGMQENYIDT